MSSSSNGRLQRGFDFEAQLLLGRLSPLLLGERLGPITRDLILADLPCPARRIGLSAASFVLERFLELWE
jgi:hypothetical protein